MKFMLLVHETTRPGEPPAGVFAAIGAIGAKESAAGTLVDVGGMLPIADGAVVTLASGTISITAGASVEAKELANGYSVYELTDLAEANEKARAFLQAHAETWPGWEGWVEVRALMEQPA
jgi:hypothetical protein